MSWMFEQGMDERRVRGGMDEASRQDRGAPCTITTAAGSWGRREIGVEDYKLEEDPWVCVRVRKRQC